jgi:hypothetical protein
MTALVGLVLILAFVAAAVAAVYRPAYAAALAVVMFGYEQALVGTSGFIAARQSLVNYAVGAVLLAATLVAMVRPPASRPRGWINPVGAMIIALYLFVFASLQWTLSPEAGRERLMGGLPYFAVLLILLPICLDSLDAVRRMTVPALLLGMLAVGAVLVNPNTTVFGGRIFAQSAGQYGIASKLNPLALADLGGIIAVLGALYLPARRTVFITLLRAGAVVLGLGIAAVSARGQLLAAIGTMVAMFPIARSVSSPKRFLATAAGGGFLALLAYVGLRLFLVGQVTERYDVASVQQGFAARLGYWQTLLAEWLGAPLAWIIGLGVAANAQFMPVTEGANYPHNLVVEILGEHGALGITLVAAAGLLLAYKITRLRALVHDAQDRAALGCIAGLALYYTMISLKQGTFSGLPIPFAFWLAAASVTYSELRSRAAAAREHEHWLDPADTTDDDIVR